MDFKAELDKLIALEAEPLPEPGGELLEIILAGKEALSRFDKKQTDISLQVEEIYEIVQENENTSALLDSLRDEKKRAARLVGAVIGLCDIVEDFREYAASGSDETLARQAAMMWRNTAKLLEECGMSRLDEPGMAGQPVDPDAHSIQSAQNSRYPKEHVARVLRSGYRYMGETARKAAVVASLGLGTEGVSFEQNNRH